MTNPKAAIAIASILGFAAAALPEHTRSKPKWGADYGEVKPVQVKLNYRPGRKKGKRK